MIRAQTYGIPSYYFSDTNRVETTIKCIELIFLFIVLFTLPLLKFEDKNMLKMKCYISTIIYLFYLLCLLYIVYETAIDPFFLDEDFKSDFLMLGMLIVAVYSPFCYCYIRTNNIENIDLHSNNIEKSVNDKHTEKKLLRQKIKERLSKFVDLKKKIFSKKSEKSVNDKRTEKKLSRQKIKEILSKFVDLKKKIFSKKIVEYINAAVITTFFIGILCIPISDLKAPEHYFEIFDTQKYKCNVVVSHYNDSAIIMEGELFQFNSSDGVYKKIKIHKRTYSVKSLKDIDSQYVYFNNVNVE